MQSEEAKKGATDDNESDSSVSELLRDNVIVGMDDLIGELETMYQQIASQAT